MLSWDPTNCNQLSCVGHLYFKDEVAFILTCGSSLYHTPSHQCRHQHSSWLLTSSLEEKSHFQGLSRFYLEVLRTRVIQNQVPVNKVLAALFISPCFCPTSSRLSLLGTERLWDLYSDLGMASSFLSSLDKWDRAGTEHKLCHLSWAPCAKRLNNDLQKKNICLLPTCLKIVVKIEPKHQWGGGNMVRMGER